MKKNGMRVTSLFLAAVMLASAPVMASAADTSANVEGEVVVDQTSQDQTSAESQNQAGQDQTSAEAQDQSQASAAENAATALVGVFKAYQEMTGETINADIIDASLNELVVTGQLEQSIAGLSDEEVEEFIAYIKSVIAQNDLKDEASINQAIDDACSKYNVTLSDSERQQIVDLLLKITSLGINLDSLVDYAESLYHSFKDGGGDSSVLSSVGTFFSNVFSSIADFFKGLFS